MKENSYSSANEIPFIALNKFDEKFKRDKLKIDKLISEISTENSNQKIDLVSSKVIKIYFESPENSWILIQNKDKYDSFKWVKLSEINNIRSLDFSR